MKRLVEHLRAELLRNAIEDVRVKEDGADHLLPHEIGHALDLLHPPNSVLAFFNAQNVMTAASNSRSFLTEGQVFRAHFDPGSAVNDIFMARAGLPMANCQPSPETPECPALQRRIWADGSFAPN